MASASSPKDSEPFAVLSSHVDVSEFTGEPGEGWSKIECVSKKAYGCGDLGQELLESLRLYVRFGVYPVLTSSLSIRIMDDKVVRRIGTELDARKDKHPSTWMTASGTIHNADDRRLILIILEFSHEYYSKLLYYLVFDGINSSLSLINYLPDHHEPCCLVALVLNRICDRGVDFELVVLGDKWSSEFNNRGVLCMCTPDSRGNPSADGMDPWKVMSRRFPKKVSEPFIADVAFTFQDKAFWANFTEGCLLCCDLRTCGTCANFIFISLPPVCVPDPEELPEDEEPEKMIRNMGCVGDSIWLVYIHRTRSYADDLLMMWTLDLAKQQWKQKVKIPAKTIFELDGFKKAGLPTTSLYYPVLMPDGALFLVLLELDQFEATEFGPIMKQFIFCIDVLGEKMLLWHGRVHDYYNSSHVILPSNFFKRLPSHVVTLFSHTASLDSILTMTGSCE